MTGGQDGERMFIIYVVELLSIKFASISVMMNDLVYQNVPLNQWMWVLFKEHNFLFRHDMQKSETSPI